jgi:hypothetical protein
MSVASLIGLGYSGYSILNGVPLLMLPSTTPENENLIKSTGAFNPDPAYSTGDLPAKQKRSLNLSITTLVSPRTWPLLKALTYGWRTVATVDYVGEVPFVYSPGNQEGFQGNCYVDEVSLTVAPDALMTLTFNLTSWIWKDFGSSNPLSKMGTPVLSPFFDTMYKPVVGWNSIVVTNALSLNAIVSNYGLRLANNWNYQTFLAGYLQAPNPGLITAGNLNVTLDISWYAMRRDRPKDSGPFKIQIGGGANDSILDTVYLDRMIREPRQIDGGVSPDQMIKWNATYFARGPKPH